MYEIAYGNKYESTKNLSRTEIAKLIRADIKAAVAKGELPKAKYSVTCKSFSGGGSIDIAVSNVEKPGFRLMNAARLVWDRDNPHAGHYDCPENARALHSDEAAIVLKRCEAIMGAYNFDGSEIQVDYFHVRFYGHARFDWQWEKTMRDAERAALDMCDVHDECKACPEMARECKRSPGPTRAVETVSEPAPMLAPIARVESAQEAFLASLGAL